MDAASLWAVVALVLSVVAVGVLGYLAARPSIVLQSDRADRAEQRATDAEHALAELGQRQLERARGAQVDADAEAEAQRALAAAPGDPRAAALALVRLRRAREDAARAAAGQDGREEGRVGGGGSVAA